MQKLERRTTTLHESLADHDQSDYVGLGERMKAIGELDAEIAALDLLLNQVYVRYEKPADQDAFFAAAAASVFAKLSSPSPINYVTLPRRLYRYHVGQQSVHVVLEILEAHVLDQLPHELQRATPHRQ